mgnify:CR=1 FL=1
MMTKEEMPACPVATTVQLIGSKWKLLILRNLRMRPWRFNELRRDLEGVSQKVLTDSLRAMEDDGIITRTVLSGNSSESGIRAFTPGRIHVSYSGRNGSVGYNVPANDDERMTKEVPI